MGCEERLAGGRLAGKKRMEGRPLLEMAERVADEITEAVVRFPGVRMYRK